MGIRIEQPNKTVCGYYGSDLNEFVDKKCNHEMTAMNIDLIMYKALKKTIRIIESKHFNEGMKTGQEKLLRLLGRFSNDISKVTGLKFEVYIIYGNPPYEKAKIVRLFDNQSTLVNQNTLIGFLDFNLTFDDLIRKEKVQLELAYGI